MRALIVFLTCTTACLVALIVKAFANEDTSENLEKFATYADWNLLKKSEVSLNYGSSNKLLISTCVYLFRK